MSNENVWFGKGCPPFIININIICPIQSHYGNLLIVYHNTLTVIWKKMYSFRPLSSNDTWESSKFLVHEGPVMVNGCSREFPEKFNLQPPTHKILILWVIWLLSYKSAIGSLLMNICHCPQVTCHVVRGGIRTNSWSH